jgi:transposase-like protein
MVELPVDPMTMRALGAAQRLAVEMIQQTAIRRTIERGIGINASAVKGWQTNFRRKERIKHLIVTNLSAWAPFPA